MLSVSNSDDAIIIKIYAYLKRHPTLHAIWRVLGHWYINRYAQLQLDIERSETIQNSKDTEYYLDNHKQTPALTSWKSFDTILCGHRKKRYTLEWDF